MVVRCRADIVSQDAGGQISIRGSRSFIRYSSGLSRSFRQRVNLKGKDRQHCMSKVLILLLKWASVNLVETAPELDF